MKRLIFLGISVEFFGTVNAYITEYINKELGVTCPKIEFDKSIYEKELKMLNPILQEGYMPKLNNASQQLEMEDLKVEDLVPITYDLISLCGVLPYKKTEQLMIICLNLLTRAALSGNVDAMYDITSISFVPQKDDVAKILNIEGVKDLDYGQMMEKLSQKLNESASEDSFIEVIKETKSKSLPISPASSPVKVLVRSHSDS